MAHKIRSEQGEYLNRMFVRIVKRSWCGVLSQI